MKTINLTDDQYVILLSFKNLISIKVRQVTNPEVIRLRQTEKEMPDGINERLDYEPGYSLGECLEDIIGCIMEEQETGEVIYIT